MKLVPDLVGEVFGEQRAVFMSLKLESRLRCEVIRALEVGASQDSLFRL